MELHNLAPAPNSKKRVTRVGRGRGSGIGKTSGRGEAGQNKRSGGGTRPMFEGGQIPLIRRLPKINRFSNARFKKVYSLANVADLEALPANTVVTAELLKEKRIIGKIEKDGLKILGNGKITKPLTIKANKWSETAAKKITKAGGKIEEA